MLRPLILFLFAAVCLSVNAQPLSCQDTCTFVLKSEKTGQVTTINSERAKTPMTPFSTFKVPNTLIILDTETVTALDTALTLDTKRYPVKSWWPDIWHQAPLDMRTAFQHSALPLYQQLAAQMGEQVMQQYVDRFNYGNRDITSGIDQFWLNGSMKISALEQVAFLQRLQRQTLKLKPSTYQKFKQIALVESTPDYRLYAKTGGGMLAQGRALGWYVGIIEKADNTFYFAMNMEAPSFQQLQRTRVKLARQLLTDEGVL